MIQIRHTASGTYILCLNISLIKTRDKTLPKKVSVSGAILLLGRRYFEYNQDGYVNISDFAVDESLQS